MLDIVLKSALPDVDDPNLLVGNEARDDAAVYDLGDGTAVISTTDFFMPIVDRPEDFGRIASVNAISDVYAMGGRPLMAIGILGWPANVIPAEVANRVMEGARAACRDAGIPLAGGHSIDNPEPIFGLAVTGRVDVANLKRNGGALPGDLLFLTKPLGTGILTTAQKRGILSEEHLALAVEAMSTLNKIGGELGTRPWVHAMTDVTGFGLLGHLGEMAEASAATGVITLAAIPRLAEETVDDLIAKGCVPGGTHRNWESFGARMGPVDADAQAILCDPQTSGGLLVAVDPAHAAEMRSLLIEWGLPSEPVGRFEASSDVLVRVE
ncbi:MAG: selenide,water dikinase [Myxococcota bacterium]